MFRKTGVGFLLSLVFVLFTYSSAVAEWYVGGAVGVAIPHTVDDLESTGTGFTITSSGFDADKAFVGGIKGGYFFESIPYLGVEVNWSMSASDIDKEAVTLTITGTATGLGAGQATGDFLFSADVQKVDLYSLSEFVICQLIGYFNFLGRTLEDINPDASDVTDMFISGNTAGAISMIP